MRVLYGKGVESGAIILLSQRGAGHHILSKHFPVLYKRGVCSSSLPHFSCFLIQLLGVMASSGTNMNAGKQQNKSVWKDEIECLMCTWRGTVKDAVYHQRVHNGKYHTCPTCKVKFPSKRDLWIHQDERHDDGR